jgi:hypothetical protein
MTPTIAITWTVRSLLAIALLAGCGETLQMNHNYRPQLERTPTVAIVPMLADASSRSDEAFARAFERSASRCALVPMPPLRARLIADDRLRGMLRTIAQRAYSAKGLTDEHRLQQVIGEDGLAELRRAMGMADVLLFPVALQMDESLGRTFARMVYRLYDLRDGRAIFQNTTDFNVNVTGERGRTLLLFVLAGHAHQDFDRHFLEASAR